ncbi:hypothetical protein P691DRAFT_784153 [Macrolepiota fuliginosa MF-IS2]|uniref:Uncharacterized protein n=1 Tax=Macrolepiota fuliginosa MF-IS2 TaxID=1400762 RepID=A0A9P6BZG3_9AGAR|nr:hypothetical protein P691DRAFT_784153 [Macrolepiota fuliginosa MF-IS2]
MPLTEPCKPAQGFYSSPVALRLHLLQKSPQMKFLLIFGDMDNLIEGWTGKFSSKQQHIWEVQVNGYGSTAVLSAEKKATFSGGPTETFGHTAFQIEGDLVVRARPLIRDCRKKYLTEVLRWKDCSGEQLVGAAILTDYLTPVRRLISNHSGRAWGAWRYLETSYCGSFQGNRLTSMTSPPSKI